MSTDGVLGAVWLPTDGWLDPSGLAKALAAGAPARGRPIRTRTRVVDRSARTAAGSPGVTVEHDGERARDPRPTSSSTPAGMFAPEIGGWPA